MPVHASSGRPIARLGRWVWALSGRMTSTPTKAAVPVSSSHTSDQIDISIVVPIRNAERYLRECLDSLTNQTRREIEILCYDDASTDSTAEVLAEYAARDPRVRVTTYPERRSASQARKDGALAARGDYLMFVDADDYLERHACEGLSATMAALGVDILQFGTSVITTNPDKKRVQQLEQFLRPLEQRLVDDEPFLRCFLSGDFGYTLWNKVYRTGFAKRAFAEVPDGSFPKAQDALAFFVLAWYARSYEGVAERYYNYRFGAGITGAPDVSLETLSVYATQALVADAVEQFVDTHDGRADRIEAAGRLRRRLATDCVTQWALRVHPDLRPAGFDILAEAWPMADLTGALHRGFHGQRAAIARSVATATTLRCTSTRVATGSGTLGVFYHRFTLGGIQRVLSILVPLYLDLGYQVVLLADEEHPGEEFEFPAGVRRVTLPKEGTDYGIRGRRLEETIRTEGIDALIYCAGSNPALLYDLMTVKATGTPLILSVHDSAFHSLLTGSPEFPLRPTVAKLADAVQVLSPAEEVYWRSQGVNAAYLPNPVPMASVDESELATEPGMILWVGRLDLWVKRCLDAVRVVARVAQTRPDVRLHVVGKEWTSEATDRIRDEIRRLGVEQNVILCGPTFSVEDYYRRADLLLVTSVTECSSMTVVEAKAFGIPIAMYTLPHLATLRDGKGFRAVPQGDIDGLARVVSSMLEDRELRDRLSREGRESLADLARVDLAEQWRILIVRAANGEPVAQSSSVDLATVGALLSNALDIYALGAEKRQDDARRQRQAPPSPTPAPPPNPVLDLPGPAPELPEPTPRKAPARRLSRRRLAAAALGVTATVVFVLLLAAVALERWAAAAVLAVAQLGVLGVGAVAAYLHLLRQQGASQRRLARQLKSDRARSQKHAASVRKANSASLRRLAQLQEQGRAGARQLTRLADSQDWTRGRADQILDRVHAIAGDTGRSARTTAALQGEFQSIRDALDAQADHPAHRTTAELGWAHVYTDTVQGSEWFRDRALSPGRWAVGYPFLYVLYRVLNELHPTSILELGLGQSTRLIAQYAAHFQPLTEHWVVEHDEGWVRDHGRAMVLPSTSQLVRLDLTSISYRTDPEVLAYSGFADRFDGRQFDLICIDGPFGGNALEFARVDVLELLPGCLAENFAILLDDHDRPGEQNTGREIRRILREAGIVHHWTEYHGEKSLLVITSAEWRFLTSL